MSAPIPVRLPPSDERNSLLTGNWHLHGQSEQAGSTYHRIFDKNGCPY